MEIKSLQTNVRPLHQSMNIDYNFSCYGSVHGYTACCIFERPTTLPVYSSGKPYWPTINCVWISSVDHGHWPVWYCPLIAWMSYCPQFHLSRSHALGSIIMGSGGLWACVCVCASWHWIDRGICLISAEFEKPIGWWSISGVEWNSLNSYTNQVFTDI